MDFLNRNRIPKSFVSILAVWKMRLMSTPYRPSALDFLCTTMYNGTTTTVYYMKSMPNIEFIIMTLQFLPSNNNCMLGNHISHIDIYSSLDAMDVVP